jgi:hypothetical protein
MTGVIKSLVIGKALKARLPLSIDNGSLAFYSSMDESQKKSSSLAQGSRVPSSSTPP